jgi:hypothetical protein
MLKVLEQLLRMEQLMLKVVVLLQLDKELT